MELVVVLVILSALGVVVTISFASSTDKPDEVYRAVARARAAAIETGQVRQVKIATPEGAFLVTSLPDGSVFADSALRVNRYSGFPDAKR